jgi:hypothetical protein
MDPKQRPAHCSSDDSASVADHRPGSSKVRPATCCGRPKNAGASTNVACTDEVACKRSMIDARGFARVVVHCFVVCFLSIALSAEADDLPSIDPEPIAQEFTAGQTVTVHGKNFPEGTITARLSTGSPASQDIPLPATRVDDKTISFLLPVGKVSPNRYLVFIEMGGKPYSVNGDLHVVSDASAPVHLDAVYPVTVYPTDRKGFDFEISGQNLAALPSDNYIIAGGRLIPAGTAKECADAKLSGDYQKPCLEVDQGVETRKLKVIGFQRAQDNGPVNIQVQVGKNTKNISNAVPLTFARFAQRTVFWGSLAIFLAIMGIIFLLVRKGVGSITIRGKRYSALTSFFLDKTTNSYSLSKFQLLLWTSVFVFGYLYLFLCRILIQWKFELPPIPDGLPGMLAISAGTAVAAAGATEARGPKGAGDIYPSAADFITTGGLVVGERFQFFAWTLVGAFGFLALLLVRDPSGLMELPKVPDNFLYLMGISSVGYLAGKVIRKPGPVIRKLFVSNVTPPSPAATMTIALEGENLAENATVKVDDKQLLVGDYALTRKKAQDQAPDPSFSTELALLLKNANDYLEGEHTVTLTNGDGQAASAAFPVNGLKIEPVDQVAQGDKPVPVTIKGQNFADGMTGLWQNQGVPENSRALAVKLVSETEAGTTLIPGNAGTGKLTLISALGLRASADVTVTSPDGAGGGSTATAASAQAGTPSPGSKSEDIDGCDVQVETATADEELPAAEGGVA